MTEPGPGARAINVDILYFAGCPYFAPALDVVREVARELGRDIVVREVEVKHEADAIRLRFLGSPTVRVDGVDVDPAARERMDYSFSCRLYGDDGVIPKALLLNALRAGST